MSTYHFIYLHPHAEEDEESLVQLKKEFNAMAAHYNTSWPTISLADREELINKLAILEWDILNHIHRNKPSSNI